MLIFIIPNVFTPFDQDGLNDAFVIVGVVGSPPQYEGLSRKFTYHVTENWDLRKQEWNASFNFVATSRISRAQASTV